MKISVKLILSALSVSVTLLELGLDLVRDRIDDKRTELYIQKRVDEEVKKQLAITMKRES